MTQIGLHSHIRVTRGIMICVAKAKLPSNLAARRPVFLRRGLNVVNLGPKLQCLLKVKEDLS